MENKKELSPVKIDRKVVKKLREHKMRTGICMQRTVENAILKYLAEEEK